MISILEHVSQKDLDKLCQNHWKEVDTPSNRRRAKIKNKLNSFIPTLANVNEIAIIDDILEQLKEIIVGKPIELESIINEFNDYGHNDYIKRHKKFKDGILKAFGYKNRFRGSDNSLKLAQGLDLKSCPYCNAQYTLVTKDKTNNKLAFQLDHFYPKAQYPYLSMSFYNLIPTCATCNLTKSNNPSFIANSYHPYVNESIADDFTFKTEKLDIAEAYITKKQDFTVDIDETGLSQKTIDHLSDFSIKKLFARHKDIIQELVWKKYIYTEKYKNNLIETYFDDGYLSKAELERLIVSNYTERKDIHKRPLSKFATDIARDLGLIK